MIDRTDLVAAVKRDLEQRGVSLAGACGAFAITKRVAWQLRDEGAGLLEKTGGNNCDGFATDYLVFRGDASVDILHDGGGENGPQWSVDPDPTLFARWRAPIDPGDTVPAPAPAPVPAPAPDPAPLPAPDPAPAPAPAPAPTDPGHEVLLRIFETFERLTSDVEEMTARLQSIDLRIQHIELNGLKIRL